MYKIELNGNYNLPLDVFNCELTPSRPSVLVSDEQFLANELAVKKLYQFVTYSKTSEEEIIAQIAKEVSSVDIIEVPNKEQKEIEAEKDSQVINATGSSATNSENDKVNTKTLEEEANKQNDNIVDATNASKTNYTEDVKNSAVNKEEVVTVADVKNAKVVTETVETVDGASKESSSKTEKKTTGRKKK